MLKKYPEGYRRCYKCRKPIFYFYMDKKGITKSKDIKEWNINNHPSKYMCNECKLKELTKLM